MRLLWFVCLSVFVIGISEAKIKRKLALKIGGPLFAAATTGAALGIAHERHHKHKGGHHYHYHHGGESKDSVHIINLPAPPIHAMWGGWNHFGGYGAMHGGIFTKEHKEYHHYDDHHGDSY